MTVTDDGGAAVTIKAEPQRIISLDPAHTETLFALGLGDRVVGDTTYCDYPEAAKTKEKVGEFDKIDLEKVVSLSPDLVLAASIDSQSVVPALRQRGITVVTLEPTDIASTLKEIDFVGKITGRSEQAKAVVQGIQAQLDSVAATVAKAQTRPRVFWELSPDLYTAGKGSFVDDIITRAGGDNIGTQVAGEWPQFSLEALIAADPQVIILADHGSAGGQSVATVKARSGWSGISAVKQGRIIEVDDVNIVSRAGPRVGDAVEYIAKVLHPDLYK